MSKQLGYAGVILPELNYFQGFFITEGFKESGERTLSFTRSLKHPESKVINKSLDVSPADQDALGALCALMAEGARVSREDLIGSAIYAIRVLTKADYFIVRGYFEASGARTKFDVLNSTSIDGAREALQMQPDVLIIKKRNFEEAMELAFRKQNPGLS